MTWFLNLNVIFFPPIGYQQGDAGTSSVEEEQVVVVLDLSEFIDLALAVKKVSIFLSACHKSMCGACWRCCFPCDRC